MRYMGLLIFLMVFSQITFAQLSGYVFIDENGNGVKDGIEENLPGAILSDGYNVIKSGEDGRFLLPGWDKQRFVTIYSGSGYACEKRFIKIAPDIKQYVFALRPKKKKAEINFVHISDTETYEHRDWVDNLKQYSKVHKPDFIIHTGDICYESGMKWHSENITEKQFRLPVYYCLGNHDLIKGDYGEQFFEQCFGPAWYAFEEGNSLFVITPMLGGDYKPGFTRDEIGGWLKNVMEAYPQNQPKIFFNHNILTLTDEFNFKINDDEYISLNDNNLKAWLYGHHHINMVKKHGDSDVISYGTATAAKGGIDHSPSGFRVVNVDSKGNTNSHFRWTYLNREIEIVSPQKEIAVLDKNGEVQISVNAYHTGIEVDSIKYSIWGEEGFNWKSSLETSKWSKMKQNSDWNWSATFSPSNQDYYELVVDAYLQSGEILHVKKKFSVMENTIPNSLNANWFNLAGNKEHHPVVSINHKLPYQLSWTANIGSNIFMSSPVLYQDNVIAAGFDDGNAENCFIVNWDANSGKEKWRYKTKNGIKNQMVIAKGIVIACDVAGITYVININTGELVWKKKSSENGLLGFGKGLVTDGDLVYTGSGKYLLALDVLSGKTVWQNEEWSGGSGTTPTMTIADNVLIVSKQWGAIYAHDIETRKLLWSRSDEGLRFRDGVLSYKDGSLWVAGRGTQDFGLGDLFQLNLKTGETIRKFPTQMQNTGTSAPIVLDDKIIVAGSHPGVAAFNRSSGEKIWQFEVGRALFYTPSYFCDRQQTIETTPVLVGDKIVFGAMDGGLYVLDVESGKLLWQTKIGAPILTSVAVSNSQIYVCDFAGNIYCFQADQN